MRILIDADGCPVVDIAIAIAKQHPIEVLLLCDSAHTYEKDGAKTLTYTQGTDSVDFALVNLLIPGDLVVTQDYGLAAMCLSRGAIVINQDGTEYTAANIDSLLFARHVAKKARNAGVRLRGMPKRTKEQDRRFKLKLTELLHPKM